MRRDTTSKKVRLDEEKEIAQLRLEAQNRAKQEKDDALNAINLKIANLNAKYVADQKIIVENRDGKMESGINIELNNLSTKYKTNYAELQTQYQLIKYGN